MRGPDGLRGFVLAAAALHLLPLFLVQSVIAFSVRVTAVISLLLGIRLTGPGWIALAVGAGGLVLLGLSAEPTPAHTLPMGWGWTLPAAALPVAALGYLGRKMPPRVATPMLAFAAGLGFSVVGIAARTLHVPDSPGQFLQPGLAGDRRQRCRGRHPVRPVPAAGRSHWDDWERPRSCSPPP